MDNLAMRRMIAMAMASLTAAPQAVMNIFSAGDEPTQDGGRGAGNYEVNRLSQQA